MALRVVILAAGRGSRLHPLTADCPKCLTELGGVTMIERQLRVLREAGITDIVIVTGYRSEMLALPGTRQIYNDRWESTNMVESLFCTENEFGDDVIIAYGDIMYEPRVLKALLDSPHDIAVLVDRQWRAYWEDRFEDPLADAESLLFDANGCITNIGDKVDCIDDIQAQYMGLMRFRDGGIDALRDARANLDRVQRSWMKTRTVHQANMTDLLMELILTGHVVHAVPVDGGWLEIDTIGDLKLAAATLEDSSNKRFVDSLAERPET